MQSSTFIRHLAFLVVAVASPLAQAEGVQRLDFDAARHLLVRSGFAPTIAEVQAMTGRTREAAVDALQRSSALPAISAGRITRSTSRCAIFCCPAPSGTFAIAAPW